MRILIANYRYFVSSGPERYLFNIERHLKAAGHDPMPFSIRYTANEPSDYDRYFVTPLSGPDQVFFDQHSSSVMTQFKTLSRLFYSREIERAILRMVDETKPDIAYVLYYLRKMSPSLLVGLKRRGIPIVSRISDYGMFCGEHHMLRDQQPCSLCLDQGIWNQVRYKCVKGSTTISALDAAATVFHRARGYFDLIDRFVTTNEFMSEMMVRAGIEPSRIVCIPTFTDMQRFRPASETSKPSYLLYVGRLDEPKGVHILIAAMDKLRGRMGSALPELRIAGVGHTQAYVDALHDMVADYHLDDRVKFLGAVSADEIPCQFRGAISSMMPALWYENLPNSVVESLSSGCPVIAAEIGSLARTISHGVDGLLHRPGDVDDLAAQIERMVTEPGLRDRLAVSARRTAETKHSPPRHMARLTELFRELTASTAIAGPRQIQIA